MNDHMLIGDVACRILDEFKMLPQITKMTYGYMISFESTKGLQTIFEQSIESCLTECYNRMKNIHDAVNAGGGHG